MHKNGYFIISLDFELMWGVLDSKTKENYGNNILGVRTAIPAMLNIFKEYNTKATFATVGFLFYENKNQLLRNSPKITPQYKNKKLNPYAFFHNIGDDESNDKYHFATSLLNQLIENGQHEIATHTYCHYYCLEEGQDVHSFEEDLQKAIELAKTKGIYIESIVFPRNQYKDTYLQICKRNGIISYRGNEKSWMYRPRNQENENIFHRLLRLLDTYINLSGHNTYKINKQTKTFMYNIKSSRFLRPYNPALSVVEPIRLKRIKDSMTHAAKNNEIFHLWWHPHNFGKHTNQNIAFLKNILEHYSFLKKQYNFESITMKDLAYKTENFG